MEYESEYRRSLLDPEGFWQQQAQDIAWFRPPATILDRDPDGAWRWFRGGQLNTAWLALDRHVEAGRGDDIALIYDSPVTHTISQLSFAQLLQRVAKVAGALAALGVVKGDRVVVYMPMVPEAVIAMLACARLGAVHSVVFGGFAPRELASRIDDATPKVLLCASGGIEFTQVIPYKPLVDQALQLAQHKVENVVVLQRPQARAILQAPRDLDWHEFEQAGEPAAPVPVDALDPLYILYTSGTTGQPKGVIRDNGGHAVALNYSMRAIYGMDPGEVFWAASDVGWVVGHSYIVYGPLIRGCTTVLFEGKPVKTPDAGVYWRVIEAHRVKTFFVAPTAFRAIRKEDPNCQLKKQYDLSSLAYQFVAGERLDPATYDWLRQHLQIPVIDHWWQTETGWPVCSAMAGLELLETKPGSPTLPVPGFDLRIVDDQGRELGPGQEGIVLLKQPLPPGTSPGIWGDYQRFVDAYLSRFPGFYLTGDGGYRDADGYIYIMGRTDDVINVAGHRLSTGGLEEVVAAHAAVAECAVVGIADPNKGQVPLGLLVLKDEVTVDTAILQQELVQMVREQIGPFTNFKRALLVARLPKTRSGKILRKLLRDLIDGRVVEIPLTIDDPAIVGEITMRLREEKIIS